MSAPTRVPLRCEVGGVALWTPRLRLARRESDPGEAPLGRAAILARLRAMADDAGPGCAGAMLASQPCAEVLPALAIAGGRILYAPRRQPRHLVELGIGRAAWEARLGAATRAAIARKARKFAAGQPGIEAALLPAARRDAAREAVDRRELVLATIGAPVDRAA
ncbi:MAG: hypothetical protein ACKOUS_10930 [Alphaproteobacteria bacterium]